jgi:hypothetical protein
MEEIKGGNCLDLEVHQLVNPTPSDVIFWGKRHPGNLRNLGTEFYIELLLKYAKRAPPPLDVTWNGRCATLRLTSTSNVEDYAERIFVIVSHRGGRFLMCSGDKNEVLDKMNAVDKIKSELKKQATAIHEAEILENKLDEVTSTNVSTAQPQAQEHSHWTRNKNKTAPIAIDIFPLETKLKAPPGEVIIAFEPSDNDVISTKSRHWNVKHKGTIAYQRLVEQFAWKLLALDCNDSTSCVDEFSNIIFDIITTEKDGRFLKIGSTQNPSHCILLSRKAALHKVKFGLRNKLVKLKPMNSQKHLANASPQVMHHSPLKTQVHPSTVPAKLPETSPMTEAVMQGLMIPELPKSACKFHGEDRVITFQPTAADVVCTKNRHWTLKHSGTVAYRKLIHKYASLLPPLDDQEYSSQLKEFCVRIVDQVIVHEQGRFLKPVEEGKGPPRCIVMSRQSSLTAVEKGFKRIRQNAKLVKAKVKSHCRGQTKVQRKHSLDPASSGQGEVSVSNTESCRKWKVSDLGKRTHASAFDAAEVSVGTCEDNMSLAKKAYPKQNGASGTQHPLFLHAEGDEMTYESKHQRAEGSRSHRRVTESDESAAGMGKNLQDDDLRRVPWDVPRMVTADGEVASHDFGFMVVHQDDLTVRRRKKLIVCRSARFTYMQA